MAITDVFASIPVADRDAAAAWYERLVGHAPDLIPNAEEAAWKLGESAWIYLIEDAERIGSALHTLLVDDLDGFLAELSERGIAFGAVETIPAAVRRTIVSDPDGNRIQIAQPLTGA